MKLGLRTFALSIALDDPLVERANGPGTAPTAFRIWSAGENDSDDGPIQFTARSAAELISEQDARGRLYSSDFDHLSITPDRPATSGRASGWHRLEVRKDAAGQPELWAVEIEWCADAKAGLEEQPPRWRYFSPAFKTSKSGEVTSYLNFALCINPLTHNLPSLASATAPTKETAMKTKAEMKAAYAKMMAADCSEEDKKEAAKMLADFFDEDEDENEGDGDKKPEGESKDGQASAKAAANNGADDNKGVGDTAGEKDDLPIEENRERAETKAAAAMAKRVAELEAKDAERDIKGMLDERKDLAPTVRKWCETQTADQVRTFLKSMPRAMAAREEKTVQGDKTVAANGLQGRELDELNAGMGIRPPVTKAHERLEDGRLRINSVRPTDWRRFQAAK